MTEVIHQNNIVKSDQNRPFFSVIMPVYNAQSHLRETIDSVLSQSDNDFELIMIDDGSTDDSLSIMLDIANGDDRIKIISKSNQGVSITRNLGAEMAIGKFLAFIDADDMWRPEKLKYHRALHSRNKSICASYGQIAFVDDSHKNIRTYSTVLDTPLNINEIIAENPVCTTSNLVVAKDIFLSSGGFDNEMSHAEDQEWLARIVSQGHFICGINKYLVDYRLSPDGLSVNLPAMYDGWKKLVHQYGATEDHKWLEAIFLRYLSRRALRAGAPSWVAFNYAMRGLSSDWHAFFSDKKRGWLTLISAWVGLILPRSTRLHLFA